VRRDSLWTQAPSPENMTFVTRIHQKHAEPPSQDPQARVSRVNCSEGMRQQGEDCRTPINTETTALPGAISYTKAAEKGFYN